MTLLTKYLLRQNLNLLLMICGIGLGIYIFVEMFDLLDDFFEAGAGWITIISYFVYRIPYILGQIFPAVYLISVLVQLGLMLRNRELLALQACSVSVGAISRSIIYYAVALSIAQLFFSQVLGVAGHKAAAQILQNEVRNKKNTVRMLPNIWFKEDNRIVHISQLYAAERRGNGLTIYTLAADDSGQVVEVLEAESFNASDLGWNLSHVVRNTPEMFLETSENQTLVDLKTDVRTFQVIDPKASVQSLPIWQLSSEISRLQNAGSNIERLQTAWHSKLAYSSSLIIMALVALALISIFRSLYVIIPSGLLVIFCYYGVFVVFVSAGEKGVVPPAMGAWAANMIFAVLAGGRLLFGKSLHN